MSGGILNSGVGRGLVARKILPIKRLRCGEVEVVSKSGPRGAGDYGVS